ncbi:PLP-dependent transferase [bacterium]|nr:PLP-dependent transferase [bacterium]
MEIKHFETISIHGNRKDKNPENALNYPIFQTSTFTFNSVDDAEKAFSFESSDYVYTRGNNPTIKQFEDRMSDLEEGSGAVAFSSGMGAISSTLFSLLKPNDQVIAHPVLYGSSYNVLNTLLPKYGVKTVFTNLTTDVFESKITKDTKVIYFETPVNPTLDIIDIKMVSNIAKKYGIKVVVDNTFATPYFQKPLTLGADVVVHSATKYIGGHGDVVAGVAIAKDIDYINSLKFNYMCEFGSVLSPFNAWLLLRGLKTLGLRVRVHSENGEKIAQYLKNHELVERVFYPNQGGIVSFELKGGFEKAKQLLNSLKMIKIAVSLGDTETLIEHPASMTHRSLSKEQLKAFNLTENMIRISAGLEHYEDIILDLDNALKTL